MATDDDREWRASYIAAMLRNARHRKVLNDLKMRLWLRSEIGACGWLGDRCDDLEHLSDVIAAWRYRRRRNRR